MHCIDTISERFRYHRKFEHSTKFAVSARSKLLFPLTTQPVIANACSHAHTQERSDEAALHREGAVRRLNVDLRDQQHGDGSLLLFKMTSQLVKQ